MKNSTIEKNITTPVKTHEIPVDHMRVLYDFVKFSPLFFL